MTLLEIVQNILSAMDDDEINSISDTVEALQVANVVQETYFEMLDGLDVPSFEKLVQLQALVDTSRPTHLILPDNVKAIKWFKYDNQTNSAVDYRDLTYLTPLQFIKQSMQAASIAGVLEVQDIEGPKLWVFTDRNPTTWTTFDNQHLVCDGYDSSLDTTLQQDKTMCWAEVIPTFDLVDDFTPDLDPNLFSMLLSEAKQTCMINFKQVSSAKETERSIRQRMRFQNDRWRQNQRKPYDMPFIAGRSCPG